MVVEQLIGGFATILTDPVNLFVFVVALTLGLFSGAIPGMNGTMTVVLMIPITFSMDPVTAIMMLSVIYAAAVYAGSISAIMFKVPGAPEAIMTTLDGYPMNQKGELKKAIRTAVFSSAVGGVIGTIILILFSPVLSDWATQLSDPEYFAVILLGLALISTIGSGNVVKSTMTLSIGLFLGTVGLDPLQSMPRFTFGFELLQSGVSLIPVILGLFAVTEVIKQINSGGHMIGEAGDDAGGFQLRDLVPPFRYLRRFPKLLGVNSVLGTMIGILPGAGATTGALFGYTFGQRIVPKDVREKFGTGVQEGVVAPESANNAAASGAFVPLLTLGIPGSATTAVILAAFILHGIRPGPELLTTQGALVYTIFAALLLANVAMLLANQPFVKVFTKIRHLPRPILLMLIMTFTIIGSYATRNIMFDLWLMLFFGLVGFIFDRYNYSIAPLIIGLVLGPLAEPALRRGLIKSQGEYIVFLQRPISAVLIIAAFFVFFIPLIQDSGLVGKFVDRFFRDQTEVKP